MAINIGLAKWLVAILKYCPELDTEGMILRRKSSD
jgi:hypothetical protein